MTDTLSMSRGNTCQGCNTGLSSCSRSSQRTAGSHSHNWCRNHNTGSGSQCCHKNNGLKGSCSLCHNSLSRFLTQSFLRKKHPLSANSWCSALGNILSLSLRKSRALTRACLRSQSLKSGNMSCCSHRRNLDSNNHHNSHLHNNAQIR